MSIFEKLSDGSDILHSNKLKNSNIADETCI